MAVDYSYRSIPLSARHDVVYINSKWADKVDMMKKQYLREYIKSFLGTHLDPKQDVQLKEIKFDIDANVKKMLKLIKDENHDETEPLTEMIEDFHKQYHSLYDRYAHLTRELRKKAHSKQENGSSSSSSSSDSDSDTKHSSNGKRDDEKMTDAARQDLETATLVIDDLKMKLASISEDKHAKLELEAVKKNLASSLDEVKEMQTQVDSLRTQKGEMEDLLSSKSVEASNEIRKLMDKITAIEQERDLLQTQKKESESELMQKGVEISQFMILMENLKGEIASKTRDHQTALEEIEDQQRKYKEMQFLFSKCSESLGMAEKKMEDMDRTAVTSKGMIADLKGEIESKTDELTTSIENLRNIEVKLCLSNQQLRVKEQSLTELEESHRATEQKYHQEITLLEDKIAMLSSIIASNSKSIMGLSEEVNSMTSQLESTVENLKKEFGSYESRINEATMEIQMTQANFTALKNLNEQFLIQLKECKDIKLRLKEKVKKEAADKEKVAKIVLGLDEKVFTLEAMMKEKDEGMMGLAEEKREAIRQLCIGIEYHTTRCDYLKDALSKARTSRTCW